MVTFLQQRHSHGADSSNSLASELWNSISGTVALLDISSHGLSSSISSTSLSSFELELRTKKESVT